MFGGDHRPNARDLVRSSANNPKEETYYEEDEEDWHEEYWAEDYGADADWYEEENFYEEEDEGRSFVLDHRMRQPGGSDPRAQLACETPLPGSSTPERRDCFPTATFNRGVEQDRASTQAVEEMSPELASQRECMEL